MVAVICFDRFFNSGAVVTDREFAVAEKGTKKMPSALERVPRGDRRAPIPAAALVKQNKKKQSKNTPALW